MSESTNTGTEEFPSLARSDDDSSFYFESDPLALKGNSDYQQLIKALVQLQAQRTKAVKDVERLQEVREEICKDPLKFVIALQNEANLDLPAPQDITPIPHIDWEKYNVHSLIQGTRPKTRKRIHQERHSPQPEVSKYSKDVVGADGKLYVRGREYNESKPQTFNQSWSDEEQRKLEELLMKYPDEAISYRRWAKISKELGTRTPLQVQSRVQKYFIALRQKGLPVPGKNPRTAVVRRHYGARRRGGPLCSVNTGKGSTFMKAFKMYEDNLESGLTEVTSSETSLDVSEEEDIADELKNSSEYQELLKLKRVKALKEQEVNMGVISHPGFSCDNCGINPIVGTRWHCLDCPPSVSVDLCQNCVKTDFASKTHEATHALQSIKSLCLKDTLNEF